ncbi:hypothetical protein GCM10009754_58920 [Amycolatopsis minnesotensis]|uniref:Uncharacterized protein n=1 Tax=Amycolatopsis minnesotensis TaxID=337894 RepID=A0ABN2RVP0_9PSEU
MGVSPRRHARSDAKSEVTRPEDDVPITGTQRHATRADGGTRIREPTTRLPAELVTEPGHQRLDDDDPETHQTALPACR